MKWVGMPQSTEEQIEEEAVSWIREVMEWKNRNDWPGAKWRVGTTQDAVVWPVSSPLKKASLTVSHPGAGCSAATRPE